MRATKTSIQFLIASLALIFVVPSIIVAIIYFYYSCMISPYYMMKVVGLALFIAPIITTIKIKHDHDQYERECYYNSSEGRMELLNKKYQGSSFCPSFYDLTDDEYHDCVGSFDFDDCYHLHESNKKSMDQFIP